MSTLGKSLAFFDDVTVREQIYKLNLKAVQLRDEIEKLESKMNTLAAKSLARNRLFFTSAAMFFGA